MDVEEDKVKRRVVAADEPLQTWSVVDNPLVQRVAYVSKHNCNADYDSAKESSVLRKLLGFRL